MLRSSSPPWRRTVPVLVASALLLAGCSAGGSETAPATSGSPAATPTDQATPSAGAERLIVVLGDSIPYNSPDDCPGCTGFVDSYAAGLGDAQGITVEAENLSRHDGAQVADILEQVEAGDADGPLEAADTIVVSAGFNDQPPYTGQGDPCAGAVQTDDEAIDLIIATTPACIADRTAAVRADYAQLLAAIRERAADARIVTLTAYNAWTGWTALGARPPEDAAAVDDLIVSALEHWRDAACAETEAVDGTCVDLLAPFNGADGRTPAGDLLAEDYTHPSQEGNDRIRDLLLEAAP